MYYCQRSKNSIAFGIMAIFWMFLFIAAFGIQSCAEMNSAKPKNQLITMYDIYNAQYADYMRTTGYSKDAAGNWVKVKTVSLTEDQKEILRTKRHVLIEVYPLIQTYDAVLALGGVPDADLQSKIFSLLDRLAMISLE